MKSYDFTPEAEAELTHALAASPDPRSFHRKLDEAIHDIATGLMQYPAYGRTQARECPLPDLPYSLIYVDRGNHFTIYAVAHHKRRRGYWKRRLRRS